MKNNRFNRKFLTWVWIFIIAINGYVAVKSILDGDGVYNHLFAIPTLLIAVSPLMIKLVHYTFRDD